MPSVIGTDIAHPATGRVDLATTSRRVNWTIREPGFGVETRLSAVLVLIVGVEPRPD